MITGNKVPSHDIDLFEYKLSVEKKSKRSYEYCLKTKKGRILFKYNINKKPGELNHTSNVVMGILKELDGKITITTDDGIIGSVGKDQIQKKVMGKLENLQEYLDAYVQNQIDNESEVLIEANKKRLEDLEVKADEFLNFLYVHNLTLPAFIWYAAEWLAGGESQNTLTGLICHCTTYFKIKSVWFLVLGKAGDGKTVVDNASETLMSPDAFENGRKTESALRRKSLICGEDYLDNKILKMGDFGGDNDIDKWSDTLDKYKELATDGKTEIEVTSDSVNEDTGERDVISFLLTGNPSVSLTSINSERFDDQIMRRSINVSPVATNEEVRKFYYYNKGLISEHRDYVISEEISMFHDYVEYIHLKYSGTKIINPYWSCLDKWFSGSEFYKTSLNLYPALVETVTLLNYDEREHFVSNGETYIISTKGDNQIVADLFNPSQGLSESSVRIFNLMLKWYKPYDPMELTEYNNGDATMRECNTIFTSGEIKNNGSKIRKLKGLPYGEIVSSLNNHGLIEVVDKMRRGNRNIYILNHMEPLESREIKFDDDEISKYMGDVCMMYGVPLSRGEKMISEKIGGKASEGWVSDLKLPPWVSKCPLHASGCPSEPVKDWIIYRPSPQKPEDDVPQSTAK